jgi:hypothetical protein
MTTTTTLKIIPNDELNVNDYFSASWLVNRQTVNTAFTKPGLIE